MQGDNCRHSALVLCRVVPASSGSLQERQTLCHELQQHFTKGMRLSDLPQHFSSDQTYPEYLVQVAD